jgi:hypothetical protein
VAKFKGENESMLAEVHRLRKSTSISQCNCLKLQALAAKLKSDIEMLQIQLKNSEEDAKVSQGQVASLQQYIRSVSFVKEQFDGSRVAGNQIKIMQDLQSENIRMRSEKEVLKAKAIDLEGELLAKTKLTDEIKAGLEARIEEMTKCLVDKDGVIESMKVPQVPELAKQDVEMQPLQVEDTNYKTLLEVHDHQVQTMNETIYQL